MATRLHLLGEPRLCLDDAWLEPPSQHLLLVTAYLATYASWVDRGQVVAWLWPEAEERAGRQNLTQLLYRHRKKRWSSGISSNGQQLRWLPESDVQAFQESLADGHWQEALACYGGDFLAGVRVDHIASVASWLEQERSGLQNGWREAALQQADALEAINESAEAARLLWQAWQQDPLAEDVLQAYMQSAARVQQRKEALEAFAHFQQLLADEFSMEPLERTRQLAEAIRAGSFDAALPMTGLPVTGLPVTGLSPQEGCLAASAFEGIVVPKGELRGTGLPSELTSFVGRETEQFDLCELLRDPACRLLTLIGSGGVGKSRTALQLARRNAAAFADGSVFVALAPLASAELLPATLSEALGVETQAALEPVARLCAYLADKALLLVLDNFEHLLAGAELLATLLEASPELKILVTSREALELQGEWRYELLGLSFPDEATTDQLEAYEAVRLFVQSARRVNPHFRLDAQSLLAVAAICRKLQGVALGIELAAAWMGVLSPQELVQELAQDFDLLERQAANLPRRHHSLRAMFDSSWALLQADERRLLARLSVFQGGLNKRAAQEVAQAPLRTLLALVNKSLLTRNSSGRFALLDIIQYYASEKLSQNAADRQALRQDHAHYYLALAETAAPKLTGSEQTQWFERLADDHDNLRAALQWTLEHDPLDTGLRLAGALWWFWQVRGHLREGRRWLERFLSLPGATPTAERAEALRGAGVLAWMQHALAEAQAYLSESLQIFRQLENDHGSALTLKALGIVFYFQENYPQARQTFDEGLELFRKLGDSRNVAGSLGNLALLAYAQKDYETARRENEAVLKRFQRLELALGIATAHTNLARVLRDQGEAKDAFLHYRQGISLAFENRMRGLLASLLEGLAHLYADLGEWRCAATLWGAADKLRRLTGATRQPGDSHDYLPYIAQAKAALTPRAFQEAWAEGQALSLEEVVTFALKGIGMKTP